MIVLLETRGDFSRHILHGVKSIEWIETSNGTHAVLFKNEHGTVLEQWPFERVLSVEVIPHVAT